MKLVEHQMGSVCGSRRHPGSEQFRACSYRVVDVGIGRTGSGSPFASLTWRPMALLGDLHDGDVTGAALDGCNHRIRTYVAQPRPRSC
jgi:hypothetical protein